MVFVLMKSPGRPLDAKTLVCNPPDVMSALLKLKVGIVQVAAPACAPMIVQSGTAPPGKADETVMVAV